MRWRTARHLESSGCGIIATLSKGYKLGKAATGQVVICSMDYVLANGTARLCDWIIPDK